MQYIKTDNQSKHMSLSLRSYEYNTVTEKALTEKALSSNFVLVRGTV